LPYMNITWQWLGSLRKLGISLLFFITCSHATGIPLPSQNMDQGKDKGLNAGMGMGIVKHTGCKTLWTWTSQADFIYNSFISGGPSMKFLGGKLDSANNLIYQKYSISGRIMYRKPRYVLFAGPVFSFENTDLQALRGEFTNIGKKEEGNENITECYDLFSKIGSSIGYQSGIGYLATPNVGFSFGHNLDLTLKGTIITSFSGSIALNLREYFEKLKENTKNLWLSFEYSISPKANKPSSHNIILGLAVGF